MVGGRRTAGYAAALLAAGLLLAGCSSGDEPEAESSPSPSAGASPSEPPPPEPIDPCSLLTADDLEAAGVDADPETTARALDPDPRTTTCMTAYPEKGGEDGWSIFYGFSMKPRVSVADAIEQVGTEKPVRLDVGDQARLVEYHAYGDRVWHGWASQGRYAVMVELFDRPRPAQVESLLGAMLARVDPAVFDFPIDLPDGCPGARSRPIVKVLGTVATATGSEGDDLRCSYANARGRTVNLSVSDYDSARAVANAVRRQERYYDETVTPARGVTVMISAGEGYAFAGGYVARPPTYRGADVQQLTVIGDYYHPLTYDVQAYRSLATWWAQQR